MASMMLVSCLFLALFSPTQAFSVPIKDGSALRQFQPMHPSSHSKLTSPRKPLSVSASSISKDSDGPISVPTVLPTNKLKVLAQTAAGAAITFGLERSVATALSSLGLRLPSAPIGEKKPKHKNIPFHKNMNDFLILKPEIKSCRHVAGVLRHVHHQGSLSHSKRACAGLLRPCARILQVRVHDTPHARTCRNLYFSRRN
jgi:hypothetical protein